MQAVDDEVIYDSLSECATPPKTVLLRALMKNLSDETVPTFNWQIPSHPSEPGSDNSECTSDSSATFCSAFENGTCNDSSGQPEASDHQNRMQAIHPDSLLMESDTHEMNGDPNTCITVRKNDCLIRVDEDQNSFSNSPVIQDMSADWSHLINSIINNNDTNSTLLTVADTLNNCDISLSTNNEAVTTGDFSAKNILSFCNTQIPQEVVQHHSTAFKAASVTMSIELFSNLGFDTEYKDRISKNSSDSHEQDAFINKGVQPTTDYEIVETGKAHCLAVSDTSRDGQYEPLPNNMDPKMVVKSIITSKKTGRKTSCDKPDGRTLSFKGLCSAAVEREGNKSEGNTNEFISSEGFQAKVVVPESTKGQTMFPKAVKFKSGHQKKIIKQRRRQSKQKSSQENIHGSRKELHNEEKPYQNCVHTGPHRTRTQTGLLPSGSTTFTQSKTASRRPYISNVKHRIRDRMSEIQQEIRAWLRGWGPPLNKARAHELIAEVQEISKNMVSSSVFSECRSVKTHEVKEISQVSEKLLHQLRSALTDPQLQEQALTDKSLECKGCTCCTEDLSTETDTSNETFSPGGENSEITQSEDSPVTLQMIQEMALADSKTVGENSTTKSPETGSINNLECYDVQTSCDSTNASFEYGRTQMFAGSLDKTKQSNTKKFSTVVKQVHFAPSGQDPPLQSAARAKHLMEVSHVVGSQTDKQSTYFSINTNLEATPSAHIKNLSHTPVCNKLTDGSSHQQTQAHTATKSTSDPKQNRARLNVHSKLNKQPNIQCTRCMNESTIEISNIPNRVSKLKGHTTCHLTHLTGTREKPTRNSSGTSEEKLVINVQSSMEPHEETCSLAVDKPLQMSNTTEGHNDQNGKKMESSRAIEKHAENVFELNSKSGTENSQHSVNSKIRHKVDSETTVMSSNRSQTVQNASKSSVTSTSEKQMENFQSLSILKDSATESQYSDQFGLTQSMMTQPEEGSFIFGIKKLWLHSSSEYVPNYELPEGFWTNKTTPFPKDLLQALENC